MLTEITTTFPDGTITRERAVYSVPLLFTDLAAFGNAAFGNAAVGCERWPSEAWCADRGIDADIDVTYYEPIASLAYHLHNSEEF